MGAAESVPQEEPDPWWQPARTLQHRQRNVQTEGRSTTNATVMMTEGSWLQKIQELGRTIQLLAEENLKLTAIKQATEQRHEEEKQRTLKTLENLREEVRQLKCSAGRAEVNKITVEQLQEEAEECQMMREIEGSLQEQIEKCHSTIERLQGEEANHKITINHLQEQLQLSEEQKQLLERNCSQLNLEIQALKLNEENREQEIKRMQSEVINEKRIHEQLLLEKEKLIEHQNGIRNVSVDNSQGSERLEDEMHQQQTGDKEILQCEATIASSSNEAPKDHAHHIGNPKASAELEKFRAEMAVKREARQRAISAVSNEMERLRTELNTERTTRKKVSQDLDDLQRKIAIQEAVNSSESSIFKEIEQLKKKLITERAEKQKISQELLQVQKQGHEEIEQILKELENEKERTQNALGENKTVQAQLEESDHMLLQKSEENDQLQTKLKSDKEKYQQQVLALKEVITISKQMLSIREGQVDQLKQNLREIETTVVERRHGAITADLKTEYENQMQNIKALKELYEERMHVMTAEKEKMTQEHKENSQKLENEMKKYAELESRTKELESLICERNETISSLQDQLSDSLDQSRNLSNELSMINNMFTQILVSSTTADMDLDKLTRLLQENHDLITEMTTKEDCNETAATLPKLLLDLIAQSNEEGDKCEEDDNPSGSVCEINHSDTEDVIDKNEKIDECVSCPESDGQVEDDTNNIVTDTTVAYDSEVNEVSEGNETVKNIETLTEVTRVSDENGNNLGVQDIASNLPKVWKVLMELISHHIAPPPSTDESQNSCYKSIDTPNGPRLVISVSQTFIRLKDLILEKKALQKELQRLKHLNGHLESKLNQQERRLSLVSSELRKTWNVVGRMRTQHQQLHTHEKVLRYELQQKRKLLNELKQELEYCREKWERARQKNSESEVEWKKLRREFASRKKHPNDSFSNSGESGYSDEKGDDSCEDEDNINKDTGQLDHEDQPFHDHSTNSEGHGETLDSSQMSSPATSLPAVTQPALLIAIESFSENMDIGEEIVQPIPELMTQALHLGSTDTILDDGPITSDPTVIEECPTISLVTLLKQQLSCFSKNLELITSGSDAFENFKALRSIFSLPAIQIPKQYNAQKEPYHSKINTSKASTVGNIQKGHVENQNNDTLSQKEKSVTEDVEQRSIPELSSTNISSSDRDSRFEKSHNHASTSKTSNEVSEKTSTVSSVVANRTPEEVLEARAARLKRLEEQCQQLFNKVTRTTHRSVALSNRLEELHGQYGSVDAQDASSPASTDIPRPPPLPTTLPVTRLPTHIENENLITAQTETTDSNEQIRTLQNTRNSTNNEQSQEEDSTREQSLQTHSTDDQHSK